MGVEDVFSAWVEITGRDPKRTKLNGKRRQRIRARLNEGYTPDRLIAAIRGVMRSPWHIGDNPDGKTYTDLGTVLRDGEQVEKFERLANAPVPVKRADIPKRIEELNRRRIRLEQEISGCSDEDYPRLLEQHTAVKREMGELEAHA